MQSLIYLPKVQLKFVSKTFRKQLFQMFFKVFFYKV